MNMTTRFHTLAPYLMRFVSIAALALASSTAQPAIKPSVVAPDFTLHAMSGPNQRLQEQRGQVVMINFWASWCEPCREEMPHLNRLYEKYRSAGFVLFGVNIDDESRSAKDIAQRLNIRFPVLLDTEKKVSKLYDLNAMPSTVLIDRDGKIRYIHHGYRTGYEDTYDKEIRELLK